MKPEDIKEYEIGEHCFGEILEVNGMGYDDIPKQQVINFINNMLDHEHNINSEMLTQKVFALCLEYLQLEVDEDESYNSSCETCGNYNHSTKFKWKY